MMGVKTNPHDPYGVGYRRVAIVNRQNDAISKEGAKHEKLLIILIKNWNSFLSSWNFE